MGTKKQDFEKFVNIIVSIGMNSTMKDIWGAIKDNIKLARIVADDFKVSYTGNIFEDMRQLESAIGNMPFEYEVLMLSQDERLKYKNLNEISINRWKEALDKTELEEGDKEAFLTLASTYIESRCRELYFTKGFYFKSKLAINFYVDKYNPHNMEFNNSVAYSLYLVGARLKKLADHIVYNYETALKKAVILYFMAKNKKDILSSKKPTEKETEELQSLYDELNEYYLLNIGEKCKTIKDEYELTREVVKCFINEKEGIKNEIEIIEQIKPKRYVMPNNALANKLTNTDVINAGAFDLYVGKLKCIETTSYVTIGYYNDNDKNLDVYKKMPEFERHISDIIMSFWECCAEQKRPCIFTDRMIAQRLVGKSKKISQKTLDEIDTAMKHFMGLVLNIDATEEGQRLGIISEDETLKYGGNYIHANFVEKAKIKGGRNITRAYKISEEPLLLKYSNDVKQTLRIPIKYLELNLDMTEKRREIASQVIRHIAAMKRSSKMNKTILFDELFKSVEIESESRDTLLNYRKFCFEALEELKKSGYIKDYSKRLKGKKIEAAIIEI